VAPGINNIPGQAIAPVQLQFHGTGAVGAVNFVCNVQLAGSPIPPTVQTNFPICSLDHNSGTLQTTVTATISTVAPKSAMMNAPSFHNPLVAGFYRLSTPLVGVLGILLLGRSRRKDRSRRKFLTILSTTFALSLLLLAIGCGGGFSNPNNLQPAINGSTPQGQFVVSVTATDSNNNTVAIATIPLTVQI
jgi:hypothetical protein